MRHLQSPLRNRPRQNRRLLRNRLHPNRRLQSLPRNRLHPNPSHQRNLSRLPLRLPQSQSGTMGRLWRPERLRHRRKRHAATKTRKVVDAATCLCPVRHRADEPDTTNNYCSVEWSRPALVGAFALRTRSVRKDESRPEPGPRSAGRRGGPCVRSRSERHVGLSLCMFDMC